MNGLLLAAGRGSWQPSPDKSWLFFAILGLIAAFFVLRPELWNRMFMARVDPRPAALVRIAFGIAVLWTLLNLAPHVRLLFSDEGIWTTELARRYYDHALSRLWDPQQGFQHWTDVFRAIAGRFTVLHLRSDPAFVFTVYGLALAATTLMTLGLWTRWTTVAAWILVNQLYDYSNIFHNSGDFVVMIYLFLGVLTQWGQAYSLDSWRRRRRAIRDGATTLPPLRRIPVWPLRLMMLQLAIIYCTTGLLKSGVTWRDGTALYFALNLERFSRWPLSEITAWGQFLGILPLMTWLVVHWEVLFPLALVGVALNAFEDARLERRWPLASAWRRFGSWSVLGLAWIIGAYLCGNAAYYYIPPRLMERGENQIRTTLLVLAIPVIALALYGVFRRFAPQLLLFTRHWLLGKRVWILFGMGMHVGIELSMNIGTFSQVMIATYPAWLSGAEVQAFWSFVTSRAALPGEAGRPARSPVLRWLAAPFDRLRFRAPGLPCLIRHHPGEASVRRAALLRIWDLGHRLRFEADPDVPPEALDVQFAGRPRLRRARAAIALTAIFPGLWWLWPTRLVPGICSLGGTLAGLILRQR